MKKIVSTICMICIIIVTLSACSDKPYKKNEIAPKILSQEQQDIVDLLSSDKQEIILFDYQVEDAYKKMEFWVEMYENGELMDRLAEVDLCVDDGKPQNGLFAVLINHHEGMTFSFTVRMDNNQYNHTSNPVRIDETLGRGYGPIDTPVEIERGKEIVLYTSIHSANGISSLSDQQRYIEQPELLRDYPFVQIVKCKFE